MTPNLHWLGVSALVGEVPQLARLPRSGSRAIPVPPPPVPFCGRGTFVPAVVRFGPGFAPTAGSPSLKQEGAGEQDARADQPTDDANSC
jgi:hypothetical protein